MRRSKMGLKIGDKVTISKEISKWYLDNPSVFVAPSGNVDKEFDDYVQVSLCHLMGVPIKGTVVGIGSTDKSDKKHRPFVRVAVKLGKWKTSSYHSQQNLQKVR